MRTSLVSAGIGTVRKEGGLNSSVSACVAACFRGTIPFCPPCILLFHCFEFALALVTSEGVAAGLPPRPSALLPPLPPLPPLLPPLPPLPPRPFSSPASPSSPPPPPLPALLLSPQGVIGPWLCACRFSCQCRVSHRTSPVLSVELPPCAPIPCAPMRPWDVPPCATPPPLYGSSPCAWHVPCAASHMEASLCAAAAAAAEAVLKALLDEWDTFPLSNSWITGTVCSQMLGIACTSDGLITKLQLVYVPLGKSIPDALSGLQSLQYLVMVGCQLTGSLPSALFTLQSLTYMDLASNSLSGSIPADISKLSFLQSLTLAENSFEGPLPTEMSYLKELHALRLSRNTLSGSLPPFLASFTNLNTLVLGVNDFSGTIPSSLGNLKNLEALALRDLRLHGLLPPPLTSLQKLFHLELSFMYLSGHVAPIVAPMKKLKILSLSFNQFTGDVPMPASPALSSVNIQSNYFTSAPIRPKNCSAVSLRLFDNCLPTLLCGSQQRQRSNASCAAFCGLVDPVLASSAATPMVLSGSALTSAGGALLLTPKANATWGTAFTAAPLPLFSYFNTKATCGYQLAFNVSLAFSLDPEAEAGGDGLVFVVSAALPDRLGGVGKRSVAVEFDSVLSVKHSDPNDNHVGVNVGGSPVSLASATAPLILNDAHTKHAWIHYDPTSGGTLRVFLSSDPDQPPTPVLRARVSLCSILQPKASSAAFYVGFTASSTAGPQAHSILNWTFTADLALGFVLDEDSFSSQGFNAAFHYASAGFDPAQDNSPAWTVKSYSTWVLPESAWPVKNQRGCVVAAVEAAHRISSNSPQPPILSVEHLRLALSSNCDGGSPTKALQFLLNATAQGKGLVEQAVYSQQMALQRRSLASTKYYGIRGIERTGFYGWFGLMLAVQRQPVIVHIEASAPSFQDYDGVRHPPSKTMMG
ncbi:unnamed protein product [Closterium sp. NIES-64]|nr:unnamed protein product [Closterium sp. NIES-64]